MVLVAEPVLRPSLAPPDEPAAFLIRQLVILRQQKQIERRDLAHAIGITANRLSQYERLLYQPNASQLLRWARLLGRDLTLVLRPEEKPLRGKTRWSDYDACHQCGVPPFEPCWGKAHFRRDGTNQQPSQIPHEGRALWPRL